MTDSSPQGMTESRYVRTREELDALPALSVIRDNADAPPITQAVCEKTSYGWFSTLREHGTWTPRLPALVLWTPDKEVTE